LIEKNVTAIAEKFWKDAGINEEFPRTLEAAVAWALPLVIAKLPALNFDTLKNWLNRRDISFVCHNESHRFRACLIAKCGKGIVFLDGGDSENERRFSLAHEIAHFIYDYLLVRESIVNRFGENGLEVLDGLRVPTPEERLQGILTGVIIGTFTHFMERSAKGEIERGDIIEAEDRADRLALELLAPMNVVLSILRKKGVNWREPSAIKMTKEILENYFGIPPAVSDRYGIMIVRNQRIPKSFQEWLEK
jgi:hypothetical protein